MTACTVDINPYLIPNLSFSTLTTGAKQLVVQDAFDKILSLLYN